jgi:hypothetical protein
MGPTVPRAPREEPDRDALVFVLPQLTEFLELSKCKRVVGIVGVCDPNRLFAAILVAFDRQPDEPGARSL